MSRTNFVLGPTGAANEGSENTVSPDDDDLKHPPHIHNIEVQCSKTMMTIDIEFNRNFDGVIYSKVRSFVNSFGNDTKKFH